MSGTDGISEIIKSIENHKGQYASIIDADPFPELIRAAFTNIPNNYVGHALLYNLSMETITTPENWAQFQDVWLETYSENKSIESCYILLPVEDENSMSPCAWTNISGLTKMVGGYQNRTREYPYDLRRLRSLCRKTYFSVVPYLNRAEEIAGSYAFGIYLFLPRQVNLLKLLEEGVKKGKSQNEIITTIAKGVKLILGAGIESPYSSYVEKNKFSYKFLIVIPRIEQIERDSCIIKEHLSLYAKLWKNRVKLGVPARIKTSLTPQLDFLNQEAYNDLGGTRCVPLDYAFLWYHFFFNAKGCLRETKKRVGKEELRSARQFIEDIRGRVPGAIKDATLKQDIAEIIDECKIRVQNKRRVGDFIMASETNWEQVNSFLNEIMKVVTLLKSGEAFKEKQVGFRIWGRPDSGKTFLIREWAKKQQVDEKLIFKELDVDIGRATKEEVSLWVNQIQEQSKMSDKPILAFIDEIDGVPPNLELYQSLFRLTEVVEKEPKGCLVLVIAGSSGRSMQEMEQLIRFHTKGDDLLRRTKVVKFSFPSHTVLDRVYIATARLLKKGEEQINRAEFLALLALAALPLYDVSDIDNLIDKGVSICKTEGTNCLRVEDVFPSSVAAEKFFKALYPETFRQVVDKVVQISND